jgi:hypothetical protein
MSNAVERFCSSRTTTSSGASTCETLAVVKAGKIDRGGPVGAVLEAAAGHTATNIYSFPSFYLDRAVRRRSKLPAERS